MTGPVSCPRNPRPGIFIAMQLFWHLFDYKHLYEIGGIDTVVYAFMAVVGSLLFVFRLMMSLVFGFGGEGDLDVTDIEHGSGFAVFSVLSIIGFFMGAGWAGLAAQLEWGLSNGVSALVAGGSGSFMMLFSSALMFLAVKLNHNVTYDLNDAVGHTGTVYLTIPAKGEGTGEITISVSGRSMTRQAVSTADKIDAFKAIVVEEVRDDGVYVVKPTGD